MFKIIEGLPQQTLGVEAVGRITREDYRDTLIPKATAMMAAGPINMLYVAGPECSGFAPAALWEDGSFGLRHWHDFKDVAVVTDRAWLRAAVTAFKPFFKGRVALFDVSEFDRAKEWIADPARPQA